ncbi:MAG: DUF1648 domain-containing protein [Methanosarcina sp.]
MRKVTLAVIGLVFLSFILSIYFYPQVPEQMATHWKLSGRSRRLHVEALGTLLHTFSDNWSCN